MEGITLIILLSAIVWFWYSSIQAKEIAVFAAKIRCDSQGVLLLDQTVALHKIRLRRDRDGRLRFERSYQFEFAVDGAERFEGIIILYANRVSHYSIDIPRSTIDKL
jgi:hypothetical protein